MPGRGSTAAAATEVRSTRPFTRAARITRSAPGPRARFRSGASRVRFGPNQRRFVFVRHRQVAPNELLVPLLFATAFPSPFAGAGFTPLLATAAAAFLAASALLVHGRPSAALSFFFARAALLVTLFDLLRFSFLFTRIFLFASSCHVTSSISNNATHPPFGFIAIQRHANTP